MTTTLQKQERVRKCSGFCFVAVGPGVSLPGDCLCEAPAPRGRRPQSTMFSAFNSEEPFNFPLFSLRCAQYKRGKPAVSTTDANRFWQGLVHVLGVRHSGIVGQDGKCRPTGQAVAPGEDQGTNNAVRHQTKPRVMGSGCQRWQKSSGGGMQHYHKAVDVAQAVL